VALSTRDTTVTRGSGGGNPEWRGEGKKKKKNSVLLRTATRARIRGLPTRSRKIGPLQAKKGVGQKNGSVGIKLVPQKDIVLREWENSQVKNQESARLRKKIVGCDTFQGVKGKAGKPSAKKIKGVRGQTQKNTKNKNTGKERPITGLQSADPSVKN